MLAAFINLDSFNKIGLLMLDQYKWRNRILVALIDSQDLIKEQRRLLDQVIPGLIERDMILIGFGIGDHPYENKLLKLDELRKTLGVKKDTIVLIGKDGSVKASWKELVDPNIVFEIIDAMPMRRQEMRERRGQ